MIMDPSRAEFEADLRAIAQRAGGAAPEFVERLLAAGRVADPLGAGGVARVSDRSLDEPTSAT